MTKILYVYVYTEGQLKYYVRWYIFNEYKLQMAKFVVGQGSTPDASAWKHL